MGRLRTVMPESRYPFECRALPDFPQIAREVVGGSVGIKRSRRVCCFVCISSSSKVQILVNLKMSRKGETSGIRLCCLNAGFPGGPTSNP
jgi:hypothetical protein